VTIAHPYVPMLKYFTIESIIRLDRASLIYGLGKPVGLKFSNTVYHIWLKKSSNLVQFRLTLRITLSESIQVVILVQNVTKEGYFFIFVQSRYFSSQPGVKGLNGQELKRSMG